MKLHELGPSLGRGRTSSHNIIAIRARHANSSLMPVGEGGIAPRLDIVPRETHGAELGPTGALDKSDGASRSASLASVHGTPSRRGRRRAGRSLGRSGAVRSRRAALCEAPHINSSVSSIRITLRQVEAPLALEEEHERYKPCDRAVIAQQTSNLPGCRASPPCGPRPRRPLSLGPLADFTGTFTGNGFNTIFRPDNKATPTQLPIPVTSDNVLELNLTAETRFFSLSLGAVLNRGAVQGDIFLKAFPICRPSTTSPSRASPPASISSRASG
jgi:hypothetical protein